MKKFIVVIVSILTILTVLVGYLFVKREMKQAAEARRQAAQLTARTEANARRLVDQLKVPPEVIHMDSHALHKIVELRRQGFQKQGVEEFYPYANQVRPGNISRSLSNSTSPSSDPGRSLPITGSVGSANYRFPASNYDENLTLEWYWINGVRDACTTIIHESKTPGPLGDYLKQHPKIYEQEIRPRLLLLTESRCNHFAIQACAALVAAGERTEYLQQRLTAMAMDSLNHAHESSRAVNLLKECGFPVPAPWPAVKSLSAYKDDTGVRNDALGDPLPPGAMLRVVHRDTATGQELHTASPLQQCPNILEGACDGQALYLTRRSRSREQGLGIYRLDVGTGKMTRVVLTGPDRVTVAAVSDDGTVLATYGKCGTKPPTANRRGARDVYRLMLWNLQTGQPIGEITPAYQIQWLRFAPHHLRLIAGDENRCMSVYDVSRRQLLYRMPLGGSPLLMFAAPKDTATSRKADGMVMLGRVANQMKVWRERTEMESAHLNPLVPVSAATRANNSNRFATFSGMQGGWLPGGVLRIWEVKDWHGDIGLAILVDSGLVRMRKLQVASPRHGHWDFATAAFSPSDEFLLTTHRGSSSIVVWDLEGRPLGRITGHAGPVKQIRFVGDKLISASEDTTLLVWDWPKIANWCRQQVKTDKADTQPATKATTKQ